MRKYDLDDEIIALYEEYESARQVAERLGCSGQTVYRTLIKHGIPRTNRHPKPEKPKRKRVNIDIQKAVEMYHSGMGASEIGKAFDCSAQAARVRLLDAGVVFRNGGTPKAEVDDAEIVRMFEGGTSQVDIAAALGTTTWVVSRRLMQHGLTRQEPKRRSIALDVDEIVRRFDDGESMASIGRAFGCSSETVRRRLQSVGYVFEPSDNKSRLTQEEREQRFAKRLSEKPGGDAYEYVSGYVTRNSKVIVRCKTCGTLSEHIAHCLVDVRMARVHECPVCAEVRRATEAEQRRAERRAEREEELAKDKHCAVCGAVFHSEQKEARYCSRKCREKRYDNSHRKKARLFNVGYDGSISWRTLSERLGHCNCEICGEPCDPDDCSWGTNGPLYPSVDCIVPMSKGGGYTWDNVQLAHCICNSAKRDLISELDIEEAVDSVKNGGRDEGRHAPGAAATACAGHRRVHRHGGRKPQHGAACQAVPRDDTRDSRVAGGLR